MILFTALMDTMDTIVYQYFQFGFRHNDKIQL